MQGETRKSANNSENNDESQDVISDESGTTPENAPIEDSIEGNSNEVEVSENNPDSEDTEPDRYTMNLSAEDETKDIKVIGEVELDMTSARSIALDADRLDDDDPETSDELNISIEDATESVSVLSAEDRALVELSASDTEDDSPDAEIIDEEEILIKDYLNEDDGEDDTSLDYLKAPVSDTENDSSDAEIIDEEEILIKDYLNEDDGENEVTPEYLKPSTPEWKLVAQQLREEREAQQREMVEKRHQEDQRVIEERQTKIGKNEEQRQKQETEFKAEWQKRQEEKQQAVEDMKQRIREEREGKLKEQAEFEENEGRRKFSYPKPERKPYPSPSELKRMEREQPKNVVDTTEAKQVSPPPKAKSGGDDLDSRVSRLSKPDEPLDSKSENDEEKED